ncbi:MAG: alpha-glucan family phosphorylase, partial [Thermoguttaceae bacterium]|nr:alpha-glucan family phosphorylase [Thermoguttaceae bacterium]
QAIALEVVRQKMEDTGMSFDDAARETAQQTVFTTHTPVEAGHDYFAPELVEEHLAPLREALGLSVKEFMALGRKDPTDVEEEFCMTVLGMKLSRYANGVSSLHGVVSRRMWNCLWPEKAEEEVPIGHITNGVHVPTWMADQMTVLFERTIPGWSQDSIDPSVWAGVNNVDYGVLWEMHCALKARLIDFTRRRYARQLVRNGVEKEEAVQKAAGILDPNALTIGFARRFATYKRAALVIGDEERFAKIVENADRPVQFIFAGKAHPADNEGKAVIRRIFNAYKRFEGKVVFLEDYDINVARHLVQGVDVWLNNPIRPLEASGTSGQKAVLNGALNFSILDGWWAEAYDGSNGFAIGDGTVHVNPEIRDARDNASLLDTLENQVIPMYYDRNEHGVSLRWVNFMKNSIATLAWRFSAHRMIADYVRCAYLPAAGGTSSATPRF